MKDKNLPPKAARAASAPGSGAPAPGSAPGAPAPGSGAPAPAARTQADRSAATRGALIAAARPLFGARGYAAVGTTEIVKAAGVTRGALYHQFADKAELFAAVFESVEVEVLQRIGNSVADIEVVDALRALRLGALAWLDACREPDIQRIVLIDAPSVLGWERWRATVMQYGGAMVEGVLQAAIDSGQVRAQPVRPLAHVLMGAMDEAALYVARSETPDAARAEMDAVISQLLDALTVG